MYRLNIVHLSKFLKISIADKFHRNENRVLKDTINFSAPESIRRIFFAEWRWWLPGAIISFFLASIIMSGWPEGLIPNIASPYLYNDGDGLVYSWFVKNVMEGWIFDNPRNGYPFGSRFLDFPGADSANNVVLKIIGAISGGEYYSVINLYFLFGFCFVLISAYCVARSFGIKRVYALSAAGIFSFAPFHFFRLGHLYYTLYFGIPLFFYFSFKCYFDSQEERGRISLARRFILALIVFIPLSSFGVYYALFGLIVVIVGGLLGSIRSGYWRPLQLATVFALIISLGVIINTAPNLYNRLLVGPNGEVAQRSSVEGEVYGLKLVQLLLPRDNHRVSSMASITKGYNVAYPLINENLFSSLGFVGALGLLILGGGLLVGLTQRAIDQRMILLSALVLVLFMFGTIGGFGAIFSGVISSSIRGWNRISIFISFGCVLAFFLFLQLIERKLFKPNLIRGVSIFLAASIFILAVFDQTAPVCRECNDRRRDEFSMDVDFIKKIENSLPQKSAIYQLPYIPFPESPFKPAKLEIYGLTVGFLNSRNLRWSSAGMKGRDGDLFYRSLAKEPIENQLKVIERLGFAGIYIDRRGFEDNGKALIGELSSVLGEAPLLARADGAVVFYRLKPVKEIDLSGLSTAQIMQKARFDKLGTRYAASIADGIDFRRPDWPEFVRDVRGLSGPEPWGRWSDAGLAPTVRFTFFAPLPQRFTMVLQAQPFGPNTGQDLVMRVGAREYRAKVQAGLHELRIPVELGRERVDAIEFFPHKPASPQQLAMNSDMRKLGIGFVHLHLAE